MKEKPNQKLHHFENEKKLRSKSESKYRVKPVLETTCIKRPPALRDHSSNRTSLLKST